MTYLAVPISAESLDAAGRQIGTALSAGAQMLELRTDYLLQLSRDSVTRLIAQVRGSSEAHVPVIVTCRNPKEGGARPHPEEVRLEVLLAALEAGAEFIDFEHANFTRKGNAEKLRAALSTHPKSRLILSAHDFKSPFADIRRLYRDIQKACPEAIPKLVYTANHINDCFDAFDLLHEAHVAPPPSGVKDPSRGRLGYMGAPDRIVLCMGEPGLISRILAKKLGAFATFASLDEQAATAPGQLTIATLKGLYRYDNIDADTELFGVIGDPVGHSLSPAIHNACFADLNMNKLYVPLHVQGGQEQFRQFLDNILARPWLHFRGFSVTIPHKHSALEYVRGRGGYVEPLAEKIGAANTLVCVAPPPSGVPRVPQPGAAGLHGLAAYNTDYAGALDAITAGMGIERKDLRDVPVAVVGAGGVSRAIVAGLTDAGARITIYNRTVERAKELAADFDCESAGLDELPQVDAKLLVNCTSIGMHPNVGATPVSAECLKSDMVVFDTVYNPAETLLLKQARAKGAKTIDGIAMFVNQAAAQFKLFTTHPANTDLMRKVVTTSGLLAQYSKTIADHRRWLRSFGNAYAARWEARMKTDAEAAICEAMARELLNTHGVAVQPNEDLSCGGPDYRCYRDNRLFYVEVTSIKRDAMTNATWLTEGPPNGPEGYCYPTKKIMDTVRNKTRQCADHNAPRVLVIGTLHAQGDVCFDDLAAVEVLTATPGYTFSSKAEVGSLDEEIHEVTDLRNSAFIRYSKAFGKAVEVASCSVSAILLCGFCSRPPTVHGILHPSPIHAFDRTLLPSVKFVKLVDGCWKTGPLEVEWV